ncbi:MAG: hypothetical protein JO359_12200, partial [Candidatus Eremiobacteraeota bacterium]|nr:hypothetical protein [Candidatus Eremiobacteraeota bacterium]
GKSVALRDFLATSRLDAVTFDVRREDSTLLAFANHFSRALEPLVPGAAAAFPALEKSVLGTAYPALTVCNWFVEHLRRVACTIVIDDLHHAFADPTTVAFLVELIERTHDRIHWILATRSDAGLPVASWLAYGRTDLPVGLDELRFTPTEALAAAQIAASEVAPPDIEALRELTDGWAVALSIALRTRTQAADLRSASLGTREMVYRYLAEQVFGSLSAAQRSFVLRSSVFFSFDAATASKLGAGDAFLDELRRSVTFLAEVAPGVYRYHDLFRDFLETELTRAGKNTWNEAVATAARLREEQGAIAEALRLFTRAADAENIVRIIEQHGIRLFERGGAELLDQALQAISDLPVRENASVLGAQALLEASRGHFDVAQPRLRAAIERAESTPLRIALVHRLAIELVRAERDCIELVEPFAFDETIERKLRLPLLGTLATAYARAGRIDGAVMAISRAIEQMEPGTDDDVRARLYQQAAFVHQFDARLQALRFARIAVDLALARNLYDVAARAYSILYTITYDETDDPVACLAILDKLLECAGKGASEQARAFGLIASYGLEAERGDEAALERLDAIVRQSHALPERARAEALLPAQALRVAWSGDFARAFELLEGTIDRQTGLERRAARAAEVALYAAAAHLDEAADRAIATATAALDASGAPAPTARWARAHLLVALSELLLGRVAAANRRLGQAERAQGSSRRVRALAHALRVVSRLAVGQQQNRTEFDAAVEQLRAEQFGGIARLLATLSFRRDGEAGFASLTPAEREILELLERGASTKQIAERTERSPRTVDTHIRSICTKLSCNGRREAVAIATGAGWFS